MNQNCPQLEAHEVRRRTGRPESHQEQETATRGGRAGSCGGGEGARGGGVRTRWDGQRQQVFIILYNISPFDIFIILFMIHS